MILLLVTYSPIAHWHPPSFGDRSPRQAEAGAERRGVTKPGLPPPGVGVALARQPLGSGERKSLSQLQHPELQRALRYKLLFIRKLWQENGWISNSISTHCGKTTLHSSLLMGPLLVRLWALYGVPRIKSWLTTFKEATYPVTWRNTLFLVWRHTGSPLGELPSNCKGLLLTLNSGITSGGDCKTIYSAGDQTQVSCMQVLPGNATCLRMISVGGMSVPDG
ncbi:uncharacterized protein LOC129404909 isoform X4 [Sorex araneus]|uniref:uncharacterized protein LOC129404909 isoform X4 n=1 Tax=Sorex araneus TaxID=42254 RepID=UPI002433EAC2|nr:uncharacterized protein LOC129404909 isoform X4 [Sorex araneus]